MHIRDRQGRHRELGEPEPDSAVSWEVGEEKVSRRDNCVQLYRGSEESQDWETAMGFVVDDFWGTS